MELVTDDFNRADGAVGANWTTTLWNSATAPLIVTNQVVTNGGGSSKFAGAFYSGAGWTGGGDQYVEITIVSQTGANATHTDYGLLIRASNTGGGQQYVIVINQNDDQALGSTTFAYHLGKVVGGADSGTPVTGTCTVSANDRLRLEAVGASTAVVKFSINGTLIATLTDSTSPLTSGNPGLYSFAGTNAISTLDNFAAGTVETTLSALIGEPITGDSLLT